MRHWWRVAGYLMLSTATGRLSAQTEPVQLRDACSRCRLDLHRHTLLNSGSYAESGPAIAVVRDSHGRYYVTTETGREQIMQLDSAGRFLKAIGRAGHGPGEYQWAGGLLMAPGDTLHVFDGVLHRWTVLSPTLQVVAMRAIPGRYLWDQTLVASRRVVLNLFVGTEGSAASPLHLVDLGEPTLFSFAGSDTAIIRRDVAATTFRKVSRAARGGVWASRVNEYRIELWSLQGSKTREFVRTPSWFKKWIVATPLSPRGAPRTEVVGIREDRAGLLWVLVRVPDPRWKQWLEAWRTPEGAFYRARDPDAVYDTYVEVLDTKNGTVLVSSLQPMMLRGFAADDLVFSTSDAAATTPQTQIWRLDATIPARR